MDFVGAGDTYLQGHFFVSLGGCVPRGTTQENPIVSQSTIRVHKITPRIGNRCPHLPGKADRVFVVCMV